MWSCFYISNNVDLQPFSEKWYKNRDLEEHPVNKRLSDCQIVTRVNKLRKLASETYTHNLEILETLRDKQKEYLSNSSPYCLKDLIELSELKCERDEKHVKGCDYALEVVFFSKTAREKWGNAWQKFMIVQFINS